MFCDRCKIEVDPMIDQWNNNRCPKCKAMLTVPSDLSGVSDEKDASAKAQSSESISPVYNEYLKKTAVFTNRGRWKKLKSLVKFFKFGTQRAQ